MLRSTFLSKILNPQQPVSHCRGFKILNKKSRSEHLIKFKPNQLFCEIKFVFGKKDRVQVPIRSSGCDVNDHLI